MVLQKPGLCLYSQGVAWIECAVWMLYSELPSPPFRVRLVETIPVGLYESDPSSLPSISDSWLSLLGEANSSVHIAAFYFTLRATDLEISEPTDSQVSAVAWLAFEM